MIKAGTTSGSSYAALMVTPQHGVRLQGDAKVEVVGSTTTTPRWLRLTRSGQAVTGYESADGSSWSKVGTVTVEDLPAQAQAGLFVASPTGVEFRQEGPGSVGGHPVATIGKADFDHVEVLAAAGQVTTAWQNTEVALSREALRGRQGGVVIGPVTPGGMEEHDGVFTVTGSGDIGGVGMGGITLPADDDPVKQSLLGVQIGLIAVVALSVLFMTSEFKTRTIRTTFTASPRRGQVLAAKAVVLAGAVFAAGLIASVAAFLLAQPLQRKGGFGPPAYPIASLTDPTVLRAVVGGALFLAVIALFSLGIGVILRRTAGAVILIFALLVVAPIVVSATSVNANIWINRATPIAGLAITQTKTVVFQTVISPWVGFAVLCCYAAVALGAAFWLQNRRDA
jgi:ABC-type transport system involved in multi-copper enzyme maturation permease subunit